MHVVISINIVEFLQTPVKIGPSNALPGEKRKKERNK